MTGVEIKDDSGAVVWSRVWFENGATDDEYIDGLEDALLAIMTCDDYDFFEDGNTDPLPQSDTTGVLLSYDSETGEWWVNPDFRAYGQSSDIVEALMERGVIQPDSEHSSAYARDEVARQLAERVSKYVGPTAH